MRVVARDLDVLELELVERGDRGVEHQRGQRPRLPRELETGLLEVVEVEVRVAEGVHEVADPEVGHLGDHVGQQRVAGDVERNTEEQVSAALVKLTRQLAVGHVELEQAVARRQR